MNALVVAIHGILTSQTDPSWPDKLDAWMYRRDPEVKVLKKEYAAGPFPRWNCWVKDPLLARGLANEIELFGASPSQGLFETCDSRGGRRSNQPERGSSSAQNPPRCLGGCNSRTPSQRSNALPPLWFVAHSNGAVIALLVTKRLIARGCRVGGLILTGAACEADVEGNGVLAWRRDGLLGVAIAYSSPDDFVLDGDPLDTAPGGRRPVFARLREFLWGKLMWPYGCLGRTGWVRGGKPFQAAPGTERTDEASGAARQPLFTRWFRGGHCGYFKPETIEATFEQIYQDIQNHLTR
jgi:hypothetical protein